VGDLGKQRDQFFIHVAGHGAGRFVRRNWIRLFFDKTSFKTFFRLRTSREENDWNALGPVLAIGFTLGTTMYMSFAVTSKHGVINGQFWKLLPLALLFAATNA
jgi:hypothetical protein